MGAVIQLVDGRVTVMSLLSKPVEQAWVKPGDVITSVDGVEYTDVNDVANALRGPKAPGRSRRDTPSTGEVLNFAEPPRITPSAGKPRN